ncbi:hypothetical protein Tco_1121829 [Tanacetum coccineum]|uniref:Uncharacterized protein n=1 Tax=Tanacetum coccineum TaxID=301880 RepID=A0ABQ5J2K0_9ASTR
MSMTKRTTSKRYDDALVSRGNNDLTIGRCNNRIKHHIQAQEPTFQVALDVLILSLLLSSFLDPQQKFVDPPFEEEILNFIRELGYPGNIKLLSDVKVDTPSFSDRKQGVKKEQIHVLPKIHKSYHQITQVVKSQSIPRRNKVDWYMANDDPILVTMRFIPQHEVVQRYGAILPDYLTNPAMKESEAYKTYHDLATGKVQLKPKYVRRSSRTKSDEPPKPSSGKRVKATAKSSEEEDDDEENVSEHEDDDDDERTESDNDGDDFVHPKFSTHNDEAKQDEEVNEEDSFDLRVQTHSHVESTDDEDSDDVIQDANIDGDMINEEETHEEVEANVLYRDVNVNLEGRDTVMTEALLPNVQATQETEDTHVILIALINPEVSSILGIVNAYLANKMNESVKTAVQLQSDRLRDEAQAENKDFLNKLDDNIKKIIKDQVKEQVKAQVSKILPRIEKTVNEQLKAEVMTRSSNESKTSHAVAANLSEVELKKILIDKMERNKSIHISNEQKNLYNALVEAYKSDKLILETYGKTVSFKRRRDEEDKDEEPSAGSNRGSKRRRAGKEPESTSAPKEKTYKTTGKSTDGSKSQHKSAGESAHTKEPMHTDKDLEEPTHQEFNIGATEEQSDEETSQHPDCPWLASVSIAEGPRESFDELMDTPMDFSAFMMNRLKIDTLTPELLAGPTFELMKGTCKSLVELEYFFNELYKATTDQLHWHNPEGQQYPHDLRKPLPLIPNSRAQVIPFDHFINNDLAYLSGGVSSRTYVNLLVHKTSLADMVISKD